MILFVLMVMLGQVPLPHARVQCAEIFRMAEDEGRTEEDGLGAVLITDSRGRMIFAASTGTYHCQAWMEGYTTWKGTLEVTRERQRFIVTLNKETP